MRVVLRSRLRIVAALALSLVAGACARNKRAGDQAALPVRLRVENHTAQQMRVFIDHDNALTRVGEVAAAASQSFVIPARLLGIAGEVRLAAEPIAAFSRYVSETLIVHPGQLIIMTLERKLDTSSVSVRD